LNFNEAGARILTAEHLPFVNQSKSNQNKLKQSKILKNCGAS